MPPSPQTIVFGDRAELAALRDRQWWSFAAIGGLYAAIGGALWLLAAARAWAPAAAAPAALAAFAVIGWAQYALGNGLHEAVHYNLHNRRTDVLANLLTAWPIGLTIRYRAIHLAHHAALGTPQDPDWPAYTDFPRSRVALAARVLGAGLGLPAFRQFLGRFLRQPERGAAPPPAGALRDTLGLLATQAAILAGFLAVFGVPGGAVFYAVFWVLPVATLGKLLATARFLCEHGSPERGWVVRTIHARSAAGTAVNWIFGAFDFAYHGEHHLFPQVPFGRLRDVHGRLRVALAAGGELPPQMARLELYDGTYPGLLWHWFRALPWRTPVLAPARA